MCISLLFKVKLFSQKSALNPFSSNLSPVCASAHVETEGGAHEAPAQVHITYCRFPSNHLSTHLIPCSCQAYDVADQRNFRILGFVLLFSFHPLNLAKYLHLMVGQVKERGETSLSSRRGRCGLLGFLTLLWKLNPTSTWMDLLPSGQKALIQRESPSSWALHASTTPWPHFLLPRPLWEPQLMSSRAPTLRGCPWRNGQPLSHIP